MTGHYFEAMGIPLVAGRLFNEHDNTSSSRVALIDEYMARQVWPGNTALGKRFRFADAADGTWITIVGIVGRVKQYTLDSDSRLALYVPHEQFPSREMTVVLRASTVDAGLTAEVKHLVGSTDPDLPIFNVRTMEQRVKQSLARRRFSMLLLGVFASFALTLATVGIYGVVSYLVAQGTRELGIRIALGASESSILRLVIRQGMLLALSGIAIGSAGAFAMARVMQSMLFGIGASDPPTYIYVCGALVLIALIASYVPARRAARVDPMVSLRWE